MKRIFRFKKGETTDGDEGIMDFLEEYLTDEGKPENNYFPKFKKDWKVTIIVEDFKKKKLSEEKK